MPKVRQGKVYLAHCFVEVSVRTQQAPRQVDLAEGELFTTATNSKSKKGTKREANSLSTPIMYTGLPAPGWMQPSYHQFQY